MIGSQRQDARMLQALLHWRPRNTDVFGRADGFCLSLVPSTTLGAVSPAKAGSKGCPRLTTGGRACRHSPAEGEAG
jgi:hypothetical protein